MTKRVADKLVLHITWKWEKTSLDRTSDIDMLKPDLPVETSPENPKEEAHGSHEYWGVLNKRCGYYAGAVRARGKRWEATNPDEAVTIVPLIFADRSMALMYIKMMLFSVQRDLDHYGVEASIIVGEKDVLGFKDPEPEAR